MKSLEVRAGHLTRNVGLNLAGQSIPIVIGILTIPYLIKGLGVEGFGVLSIAWMLLGYFTLFDLGLGRATTKFVAEELRHGETQRLRSLVWTSLVVNVSFGFVGGLLVALFSPVLAERVLEIPPELVEPAITTFLILAFSAPIVLAAASLRGVLEAAQRFDYINGVRAISSSLTFLLPAVGLLAGLGIPGIVLLLMISRLAEALAYFFLNRKALPVLKSGFSFDPTSVRQLIGFGGWVTVTNVINPILSYLDRFMIGALVSMAAVAYYAAPFEIVTRLWILPASLTMTLFPAFSTIGTASKEVLAGYHARSVKYLLVLMGPLVMILVFLADDILRVWLGSDFAENSTSAFRILAFGVLFNSLAQIPFVMIQGLGRPDITAKFHLLEVLLYLPITWILVKQAGVTGGALAWMVRATIDFLLLFGASSKFTGVAVYRERGLVRGAAFVAATGAILVVASMLDPSVLVKALVSSIVAVFFVLVAWKYVFDAAERQFIISIFRSPLRPTKEIP